MSLWIPARELEITDIDDSRYWQWTPLPPPDEEEEVAELLEAPRLGIVGRVQLKKLLLETSYSAYLVFKLKEDSYGLNTAKGQLRFAGGAGNYPEGEECTVSFSESRKREDDGWMEVKLGELSNDLGGDDGCVLEAKLFEIGEWKKGLLLRGIMLLPARRDFNELVSSYLQSKLSSILEEAYDDPNSPSRIISRIESIKIKIRSMCILSTPRTSDNNLVVHLLYDLIDALSDCRVFAHSRAASSKKLDFFVGRFISEFLFKKKMGKQLDGFEIRLKLIFQDKDERLGSLMHALCDSSQITGFSASQYY